MDDLPDAIAKLVDARVREVLEERDRAEQRRRLVELLVVRAESLARQEEAREKKRQREAADHVARKAELVRVRASLRELKRHPPGVAHFSRGLAAFVAVLAVALGGVFFPACVEPIVGRSVLAGTLLCPYACSGCRGPGRVFTWHEASGGFEGNVSTQLCHNPDVALEGLTWMDVTGREEKDLAKDRLTLWTSVPIDTLLVALCLLLVVPFLAGRVRRGEAVLERARLEARERALVAVERAG